MAKSKKTAPALPKALQGYEKHPVDGLLEFYESLSKSLLKDRGAPADLDALMQIDKPDRSIKKFIEILWMAERVREHIGNQDAEGAALFMHRLAVAVHKAKLSLSGEHREGFKKDRRWLDVAIRHAMGKRPKANSSGLWTYFRNNHQGPDSALEVEGRGFAGSVHWEKSEVDGYLIFDDKGDGDSINFETFRKAASPLKK